MLDQMNPAMNEFRKALQADADLNLAAGRQAGNLGVALGRTARLGIVVALVLISLFCALLGWWLNYAVSAPLSGMTVAMRQLAERDLTTDIPGLGRGDEIGAMAHAVEMFRDSIVQANQLAVEQASDHLVREQRARHVDSLVGNFEAIVGTLVGQLASGSTALEGTAQAMTGAASHANHQATTVAAAAEEASTGLQTVAAAAEELTASIGEISRQVAQSAKITGRAVEDAQRTDKIVRALAEGAERIGGWWS